MWVAFVWGVGVSCGAAFGLLLFIVLFWGLEWLTGRGVAAAAEVAGVHQESLEALLRRNELTEEMVTHLATIAAMSPGYRDRELL